MNTHILDVKYTPGFVCAPEALFARVVAESSWDRRMAARQTASYGLAYNYSGITYPDVPMPDFLSEVAERIAGVVHHPITNCLANLYETGESRMGFHSDSASGVAPGTSTSIVSLGSSRPLTFRLKASPDQTQVLQLEPGSLLVMATSVQESWMHALLPVAESSPRISLTFRHITRKEKGS